MSSPSVITGQPAPIAEALATNRESMTNYLEKARLIYDQAMSIQHECVSLGGKATPPPIAPEEAEAKAKAIFANGDDGGWAGLQYAHAYWQSLKHPWFQQIVRQHGDLAAADQAKQQARDTALIEKAAALASSLFKVSVQVDRVDFASVKTSSSAARSNQKSWETEIAASLSRIVQAADEVSLPKIQQALEPASQLSAPEKLLALETLRLALEQDKKLQLRELAFAKYTEESNRLARERVELRLQKCLKTIESMEGATAVHLEDTYQRLQGEMEKVTAWQQFEEQVENFESHVATTSRKQDLLECAVASLRRLGYETVQIMQSLGPPEIASVYLQDPNDEERLALLQVALEKGMLAAELIRREETNGSQMQKRRDTEAQKRLCNALESVQSALASRWECTVKKQVAPGTVEPKVRKDLPARVRRQRVGAALQYKHSG